MQMNDQSLERNPAPDETTLRYMFRLAGPVVVATISFTVMQFIDRIMVSRLGTAPLAAILPAGMVAAVPAFCIMGVFIGLGTFVSQSFGKNRKSQCGAYFWQAIYMGLVLSLLMLAVCWPFAPEIFQVLGHQDDVAALEVIYFRIMLIAQMALIFVWAGLQFFAGIHRPNIVMYSALVAQVVNVIANYVLIFGKFGFPAMGIAGAAWGTVIGVAVNAAIRMAVLLFGDTRNEFHTARIPMPDLRKMGAVLKVGLPAGAEMAVNIGMWGAILFWLVGKFGSQAQAATSAVIACTNLVIVPIAGIKIALTAAVGKSIGSGKSRVAVKQTRLCLRLTLIYTGLAGLGFLLFGRQLMEMWSGDDKVIQIGTGILIFAAVYQLFQAVRMVYSGALRGAGDTLWLAWVSALGAVIILGLGGLIMIRTLPDLGVRGPWTAAALSIVVVGAANRFRFKSGNWKRINLFRSADDEMAVN